MTSPRLAILAAPIVLVGTLALAGCGTVPKPAEPKIVVDTAHDPVAASCVPSTLGPAPAYPDTDAALKAAPNMFERVRLLVAGRLLRIQRAGALEGVATACGGQ